MEEIENLDGHRRGGVVGEGVSEIIVGTEKHVTSSFAERHQPDSRVSEVILGLYVAPRRRVEVVDLLDRAAVSAAAVQVEHDVERAGLAKTDHVKDRLSRRHHIWPTLVTAPLRTYEDPVDHLARSRDRKTRVS